MLQVVEINYIRHEVNQKGRSYKDVAKSVKHDWRTVKKYANQEEFPQTLKQKRKSPVMDKVKPIIDQWLEEDLKFKKKFQRTAKRMFTQLMEEHNFEGSERSVRRYVSKRKAELKKEAEGAALPLETVPGTAQVDFGKAPFHYGGTVIELPFLVMSFPFSTTFYYQVFPSENTECFLEGLQRIFMRLGNVPKTIRFDNLSPAVVKIHNNGERDLTDSFERFVLHYGFEAEFCNPGSGNEKGHVENMVKYIRNNFLLPAPYFTDLDDFNEQQWLLAEKDQLRVHYEKEIEQRVLHQQTVEKHLVLPEKPFHCGRIQQ
ncbi:IS21 family transposase [Lysinibacillus macroides]|uniref:IS21 family transposase n=1 Tax=Lysinibacillus macroides TaxID=33935 RepID=UPI000A554592|nr:IS21 family transposase [Lysinibacillus macroides]